MELNDIRSLRLTSRKISSIADEYLFYEVYTFFESTSLQKLADIAKCRPSIRKGIKSLFFQADGLEYETFEKWDSNRRQRAEAFLFRYQLALSQMAKDSGSSWLEERRRRIQPLQQTLLSLPQRPPYSPEQWQVLEGSYGAFERTVTQQRIMQEIETTRNTLADLFRASPNLTALQINAGACLRVSRALMHKPFQDTLVIPNDTRKLAEHVLIASLLAARNASGSP